MTDSPAAGGSGSFDPAPSASDDAAARVSIASVASPDVAAVGWIVGTDGPLPATLGIDRAALAALGFSGAPGQVIAVPDTTGRPAVLAGIGDLRSTTKNALRDAAGSLAQSASRHTDLAVVVPEASAVSPADAGQAVTEGVLLARYRYDVLKTKGHGAHLSALTLVATAHADEVEAGTARGAILARATQLARDLANCPPAHLTALEMGSIATRLGRQLGFGVETFDKATLTEMGCGGLLAVNRGSVDPPLMVKLTYRPAGTPTGHLTLVGKGIMYDSGGISLKPADGTHATMKNDMSGAGAVLAAISVLGELGCTTAVTGYLMCTDNMPSGTALKMGDVISVRGGTTVEIINTDAEGRLVMSDALVLATEEPTDAIVDIATLTGAALRALGPEIAAVIGNDAGLVAQVEAAAEATDEPVWELPLARRYRNYLDTPLADIKNLGGEHAGAISAALFLEEFVGGKPWAHLDIAGVAQSDTDNTWHTAGCSGFGARLLVELALAFTPPSAGEG